VNIGSCKNTLCSVVHKICNNVPVHLTQFIPVNTLEDKSGQKSHKILYLFYTYYIYVISSDPLIFI
jgi:hypothetical protein